MRKLHESSKNSEISTSNGIALIRQHQFDAEAAALHGIVADNLVLLVGDIQQLCFETKRYFVLDVEIMADKDTLVGVGV